MPAIIVEGKWLLVEPARYLGATSLHKITTEQLQSYREKRAAKGTSPAFINMEMGAIRRILKRAKRWHLIEQELRPLKEKHRVGRALSAEEKAGLLEVAGINPNWQIVRCAAILALNTTMRGCELKNLRWKDVDLVARTLTVQRSKTDAGERVIPLNTEAMKTMLELLKRAEALEGAKLENYVFPGCENGKIDPTRPQQTWRTAWRRMTRVIRCPLCGKLQDPAKACRNVDCKAELSRIQSAIAGLRFHDLRHHAITELAESEKTSDQTIRSIAGHVSPKMLAHYSHIRLAAMRAALDGLSGGSADKSYDTKNDTNPQAPSTPNSQVIEINGRPVGTRTPDLYRVKVAL
jgi:integrase